MFLLLLASCGKYEPDPVDTDVGGTRPPTTSDTGTFVPYVQEWTVPDLPHACYTVIAYDDDVDDDIDRIEVEVHDSPFGYTRFEIYDGPWIEDGLLFARDRAYDAYGYALSEQEDSDGDGIADVIELFTYDPMGNLLLYEADEDGDGTIDVVQTYYLDADGDRIEVEVSDGAGVIQERWLYSYDADDRRDHIDIDLGDDGVTDQLYTYTWANPAPDESSFTFSWDDGVDGMADSIWSYEYDVDDNLIAYTSDEDGDGTVEWEYDYVYVGGLRQTLDVSQYTGGAWVADWHWDYTYDAQDRNDTESFWFEYSGDSNPEDTYLATYHWDCP